MVKNIYKTIILSVIFSAIFIFGCSNDFAGFVASNDLDERLISKNDFPFLDARGWRNVSFGNDYKFIIVTDTHMEDGADFGLRRLPEAVKKHGAKFAVNIGDITQHGTEHDVDMFIEIADSLSDSKTIPFYPTIGNHDIYFGTWSVWREKIGSTNYRINIKDDNEKIHTSLLFMDSANAFLGRKQLDWLEFELKKELPANIFVFTHAAFFTTGIKMQQLTDTRERARVAHILKDKASIMFMGHSHQRAINEAGNVRYVTFEDFKTTGIYIVVEVKPTGVTYTFDKL